VRLPALEKNILIYRALQMTLFLFYAEDLRRQIVESVGPLAIRNKTPELKGARLLKAIFRTLEDDRIISRVESIELQGLLEHRNKIAHEIQLLTGDIAIPGRAYRFRDHLPLKYDYAAVGKIKEWRKALDDRLPSKYVITLSFDGLLFEAAEYAYEKELSTLKRRIDRQFSVRRKQIQESRSRPSRSNRSRVEHAPV